MTYPSGPVASPPPPLTQTDRQAGGHTNKTRDTNHGNTPFFPTDGLYVLQHLDRLESPLMWTPALPTWLRIIIKLTLARQRWPTNSTSEFVTNSHGASNENAAYVFSLEMKFQTQKMIHKNSHFILIFNDELVTRNSISIHIVCSRGNATTCFLNGRVPPARFRTVIMSKV